MTVSNGQDVNAAVTNAAFMSRTADTSTTGVVNLNNTSDVNSGDEITNAQRLINEVADSDGTNGEGDATRKVYSSNRVIADGDDRKTAIGKLDGNMPVSPATNGGLVHGNGTSGQMDISSGVRVSGGAGNPNLSVDGTMSVGGTAVFNGNVTILGTTTSVNSTNTDVLDKNITINKGGDDAGSEGSGLTVERTGTDGSLVYEDALTSKFKLGALGSEVEVATISGQQVITNKDIDGGTASNTSRSTLPKGSTATLNGLTRKQGTILYDTTLDVLKFDDGTSLIQLAAGGGGGSTLVASNKIINGGFDYFQHGAATVAKSLTGTSSYIGPDRYKIRTNGSAVGSIERVVDSPNYLTENCLDILTNASSSADDEGVEVLQRIESNFARELTSETASLGIYYKAEAAAPTELNIQLFTADSKDDFSTLTSISSSRVVLTNDDTWRHAVFENITMPSDCGDGIEVRLTFDNVGTISTNAHIRVTQLKFEKSSTADEFVYAGSTDVQELRLCQRYTTKSYGVDIDAGTNTSNGLIVGTGVNGIGNSISLCCNAEFKSTMRTDSPTIVLYSKIGSINTTSLWNGFSDIGLTPHIAAAFNGNGISQVDANSATPFSNPNPYGFHYYATDEL